MTETKVSPPPNISSVWVGHCSSIGGTALLTSITAIYDCIISNETNPYDKAADYFIVNAKQQTDEKTKNWVNRENT